MNLGQSHPELARRYDHLVRLCWERGIEIGITSSTRSRAAQEAMYYRWRLPKNHPNHYDVPSVANPNSDGGPSPWGWRWRGSKHMVQADGYSHALDLHWHGIHAAGFEQLAMLVGLRQTVPNENWHYQFANRRVIFAAPLLDLPSPIPPGPTPPAPEEHDVAALIKADDGTDTIWITDYVTKRHVVDGNEYQFLRDQPGVVESLDGTPLILPRAWVAGIPTLTP